MATSADEVGGLGLSEPVAVDRGGERGARRRPGALAARVQNIDLRSTWQVAAGSFLVPLGIVVILISWYGSAHTPYVQQQIPYLVSGSFIGLGLMFVGGLLYWAHWLYRIYDQADLNHASAMARQEELMERLIDAVSASGAARQPGPNGSAAAMAQPKPGVTAAAGGPALVATATGSNVHRSDCAIVARHSVGLRHLSVDEASGLPMCRICHPGDLITQR